MIRLGNFGASGDPLVIWRISSKNRFDPAGAEAAPATSFGQRGGWHCRVARAWKGPASTRGLAMMRAEADE